MVDHLTPLTKIDSSGWLFDGQLNEGVRKGNILNSNTQMNTQTFTTIDHS